MTSYEAVCDCCMETQHLVSPVLEVPDCPVCGVGKLLGPWPVRRRFESDTNFDIHFRLEPRDELEAEAAQRD